MSQTVKHNVAASKVEIVICVNVCWCLHHSFPNIVGPQDMIWQRNLIPPVRHLSYWRCGGSLIREGFWMTNWTITIWITLERKQQEASSSQSELLLVVWLLKVEEQNEINAECHTHIRDPSRDFPQLPYLSARTCIIRYQKPPKASEKLQKDERITDNTLNHTQTRRQKSEG